MRVLVTGAAGMLGHRVVAVAAERGHDAIGTDLPELDLTDATGINQMADALRSADVITSKHIGLIHAIGAVRNAAHHGVDNEINKVWSLGHNSLMDVALLTLDVVKSLMEWTTRQFPVI